MGSILRLPNVGAEPRLLWSFTDRGNADRGDRGTAAVADWGANLAKTLEAEMEGIGMEHDGTYHEGMGMRHILHPVFGGIRCGFRD